MFYTKKTAGGYTCGFIFFQSEIKKRALAIHLLSRAAPPPIVISDLLYHFQLFFAKKNKKDEK